VFSLLRTHKLDFRKRSFSSSSYVMLKNISGEDA